MFEKDETIVKYSVLMIKTIYLPANTCCTSKEEELTNFDQDRIRFELDQKIKTLN
jgi:hypothetical protein